MRVLVVDDQVANRRLLSRMVGRLGHTVDEAASGHEALAQLETEEYGLVFMDLQMPGIDGLETTRRIRAGRASAVPIWALTGACDEETRQACRAAGIDEILSKPCMLEDIDRALREVGGAGAPNRSQ